MQHAPDNGLYRRILDTARNLLISDGYSQLSMRRIAGEIGYSATSIYLHFENKDQLVHALIDDGVELLNSQLKRVGLEDVTPRKRLEDLCRAYVQFALQNPEYYEIMYLLHPEHMARYPVEKYRRARKNLELFSVVFEEGIRDGSFEDVAPLLAASVIWSSLHGIVSLLISERIDARLESARMLDESIQRILRGYELEPTHASPES